MTDKNKPYQICVLGSGPAGQTIAVKAARRGYRVIVLETREPGGTCALRGCNPKKVLANGARLIDAANRASGKMTVAKPIELDWPTMHEFQTEFTAPVPESTREKFARAGIDFQIGSPKFVGPDQIEINDQTVVAQRIVIATGAKPSPLPFEGNEYVETSDDFLNRQKLPQRILFIGGGYISMEFAHVAVRCGSRVTVVERGPRLLDPFDPDLVEQLTKYSIGSGIEIHTGCEISKIQQQPGGTLAVTIDSSEPTTEQADSEQRDSEQRDSEQRDSPRTIVVDLVIHGAGRTANLEGLNLDAANLHTSAKGLRIDPHGRCVGTKSIYAVGDCADSGLPPLTPTAQYTGETVLHNLLVDLGDEGSPIAIDPGPVTAVAFTPVQIAQVGMTHDQAQQRVANLRVSQDDTSSWGSIRKTAQTCAGYKILIDEDSDKIVGAHLLGPGADEQINLFTLAIRFGLTTEDLKTTLFGYPTMAADIQRML